MQLISHPAHSPGAITAVDADVTRAPDGLVLSYTLTGDIDALVLPAKAEPAAPTTSGKRPASNCSSAATAPPIASLISARRANGPPMPSIRTAKAGAKFRAEIAIATDGDAQSLNLTASLVTDLDDVTRLALTAVIEERDGPQKLLGARPPRRAARFPP